MAPIMTHYLYRYGGGKFEVEIDEYHIKVEGKTLTTTRPQDNKVIVKAEFKDNRWQTIEGDVSLELRLQWLRMKQHLQQIEAQLQAEAQAGNSASKQSRQQRDGGRD